VAAARLDYFSLQIENGIGLGQRLIGLEPVKRVLHGLYEMGVKLGWRKAANGGGSPPAGQIAEIIEHGAREGVGEIRLPGEDEEIRHLVGVFQDGDNRFEGFPDLFGQLGLF
jgi:hypothetical protein